MLKHIIKRELLDNLISLRFSLTLIIMMLTMSASALLFTSDYEEAMSAYKVNLQENQKQLEEIFKSRGMPHTLRDIMINNGQWAYKRPSEFTFIADGDDKDLPNAFSVSAFRVNGPNTKLRTNPLLQPFENLDWSLVIGIVMSFAAIVMTFDAISGDRERGTLKLSMANSIPRATILLGKYIGAVASLLIPLLIGILLNVIIIAISGIIHINSLVLARIGVVSVFSSLYVSVFVALGMFVSSLTRGSAMSLVILLLSWVMMVIVIPGVGGIVVSRFVSMPSQDKVGADAQVAWDRAKDNYLDQHPEMRGIAFGNSPGDSENIAGPLAASEASDDVWRQYREAVIRRIKVGQNMTRLSPLGLYKHAVETIAGTGISHYESFMKQVSQFRVALKGVMLDKYVLDPHKDYGSVYSWYREYMDKLEFGLSDVPEFHEKPIALRDAVKAVAWDTFFLFLFSFLLFMGGIVSFLRYDVR